MSKEEAVSADVAAVDGTESEAEAVAPGLSTMLASLASVPEDKQTFNVKQLLKCVETQQQLLELIADPDKWAEVGAPSRHSGRQPPRSHSCMPPRVPRSPVRPPDARRLGPQANPDIDVHAKASALFLENYYYGITGMNHVVSLDMLEPEAVDSGLCAELITPHEAG